MPADVLPDRLPTEQWAKIFQRAATILCKGRHLKTSKLEGHLRYPQLRIVCKGFRTVFKEQAGLSGYLFLDKHVSALALPILRREFCFQIILYICSTATATAQVLISSCRSGVRSQS